MNQAKNGDALPGEWVDGFLFVGNQLALDLLNTKLVIEGEEVEKLPDTPAFEHWCAAAGLDTRTEADQQTPKAASPARHPDSAGMAAEARAFRERLRDAVIGLEAGGLPDAAFLAELNSLLTRYRGYWLVGVNQGKLEKQLLFGSRHEDRFWGHIAESVASLFTAADRIRIRKCEHCVVHFYDSSKKGSRRWCSMNLCGNRLKVAAYQQRKRASRAVEPSPGRTSD